MRKEYTAHLLLQPIPIPKPPSAGSASLTLTMATGNPFGLCLNRPITRTKFQRPNPSALVEHRQWKPHRSPASVHVRGNSEEYSICRHSARNMLDLLVLGLLCPGIAWCLHYHSESTETRWKINHLFQANHIPTNSTRLDEARMYRTRTYTVNF